MAQIYIDKRSNVCDRFCLYQQKNKNKITDEGEIDSDKK